MNVNERIARALGWLPYRQANPQIDWASMPDYSAGWGWQSPEGKREAFVPDYAHSLDACLPVLADFEARGYGWRIESLCMVGKTSGGEGYVAEIGRWQSGGPWKIVAQSDTEDSPALALAACIAEALAEYDKGPL